MACAKTFESLSHDIIEERMKRKATWGWKRMHLLPWKNCQRYCHAVI